MVPRMHIYRLYPRVKSTPGSLVHAPMHLRSCIRHLEESKTMVLIHPHVSVMGFELSVNHHHPTEPNTKCPSVEAELWKENSALASTRHFSNWFSCESLLNFGALATYLPVDTAEGVLALELGRLGIRWYWWYDLGLLLPLWDLMFPFKVETQVLSAVEVLLGEEHREEREEGRVVFSSFGRVFVQHECPGFKPQHCINQVWWCMPTIPALWGWGRQTDRESKIFLNYRANLRTLWST